ncbi:dynein intermediate chain, putative [Hepatocystis sp. ex Piliocolobus tephrosceles]|nr:dynein intermediate chain, putative [Hepatocystis sp. ex Piliocolobus tephrosceles]
MDKKNVKKYKDNGKVEHMNKIKIMKKNRLEVSMKDKINKNDLPVKYEIDPPKKIDKENKEKKKFKYDNKKNNDSYLVSKHINSDKKQYTLKNSLLSDIHKFAKAKEKLTDPSELFNNSNDTTRFVFTSSFDSSNFNFTFFNYMLFFNCSIINIELKQNIKSTLEVNFTNDISALFFKKFNATAVNKNHFFALLEKYSSTDELLSIKNALINYKLYDVLIIKDAQDYNKTKHFIVTDEAAYYNFFKKCKRYIEVFEQNEEKNILIQTNEKQNELSCVFIKPKNYYSSYAEEIEKEILATNIIEFRKKLKKYIYINKKHNTDVQQQFLDYDKLVSIQDVYEPNSVTAVKTLDFYSNNLIILQENSSQTYKAIYKNIGIQYNIDFLKKKKEDIMKSNDLKNYLYKIFPYIEKFTIENNIISEANQKQYTLDLDILSFKNKKYLNKIFIYTDVKYTTNKIVLFTLYLFKINYLILIVYVNNYKNEKFIEGVNTDSYILIWSYGNYINPLYALISPYQITSAIVNEKSYDLVFAGCSNGLIVIWQLPPNFHGNFNSYSAISDKTIDIEPYIFSNIEQSHKREITSLVFLTDKTLILTDRSISFSDQKNFHLLVSVSIDGSILIWDATNIKIASAVNTSKKKKKKEIQDELYSFKPLFRINITRPNTEYSLGFTYFHFVEIDENISSYFAFSEEGEYVFGNIYDCAQKQKNYSIIDTMNDDYKNYKTILCVKRNNIIKYIILTLTDTNFYLWLENEQHPFYVSPASNDLYSCCEFSQTRIGVIYIGKKNGHIEIWNLLEHKDHCIYSISISSYSLTCISISNYLDNTLINMNEKKMISFVDNNKYNDLENWDEIVDTNEELINKDEDDVYKYSYNKIIIGDSSGCVFVYQIEESFLNPTKKEIDEFLLWTDNMIRVNKQIKERQLQLSEDKLKTPKKEDGNTNEKKEELKSKLDEDYKNVFEKCKNYLLGNKI